MPWSAQKPIMVMVAQYGGLAAGRTTEHAGMTHAPAQDTALSASESNPLFSLIKAFLGCAASPVVQRTGYSGTMSGPAGATQLRRFCGISGCP